MPAPDTPTEKKRLRERMTLTPLQEFGERYGPYAFGLVSLMIIWFGIVNPELNQSRKNSDEFIKSAEIMRETSATMERASDTIEDVAKILEATSVRLELITDKIKNGGPE